MSIDRLRNGDLEDLTARSVQTQALSRTRIFVSGTARCGTFRLRRRSCSTAWQTVPVLSWSCQSQAQRWSDSPSSTRRFVLFPRNQSSDPGAPEPAALPPCLLPVNNLGYSGSFKSDRVRFRSFLSGGVRSTRDRGRPGGGAMTGLPADGVRQATLLAYSFASGGSGVSTQFASIVYLGEQGDGLASTF